MRIRENMLQYC